MTAFVAFWPGVSEAFFVLTPTSLHGKREQIKLETVDGILADLFFLKAGQDYHQQGKVSRMAGTNGAKLSRGATKLV